VDTDTALLPLNISLLRSAGFPANLSGSSASPRSAIQGLPARLEGSNWRIHNYNYAACICLDERRLSCPLLSQTSVITTSLTGSLLSLFKRDLKLREGGLYRTPKTFIPADLPLREPLLSPHLGVLAVRLVSLPLYLFQDVLLPLHPILDPPCRNALVGVSE